MSTDSFIPITLFLVIAYIIKVVSDNRTRRVLIEKGEINENLKYLYADKLAYAVPSSLKWGMVFIAIGLAFFLSQVIDLGRHDETTFFAMLFIFGGAALIVFYFIAGKMQKKAESEGTVS